MTEQGSDVSIPPETEVPAGGPSGMESREAPAPSFFDGDDQPRPEIVEGLIREGQLVAFAGPYGMGKSPSLTDIAMHVIFGIPWCERLVSQRPVILFDFETPVATFRRNVKLIANRLGVALPQVPDHLDVYLEHGDPDAPQTKRLLAAIAGNTDTRLELIGDSLSKKENALVLIDPLELMFRVNTVKKEELLRLYGMLRRRLTGYPHAATVMTFNLRKRDRKNGREDLLINPRGWLEEVCGTLDILNRSDVRLGMDFHGEDARVINGIRRGEEMHPLLVRPVEIEPGQYAGFDLHPADAHTVERVLTTKQRIYWEKLPKEFRFEEVADHIVPRATLDRLLKRAKSVGLVEQKNAIWLKLAPVGVKR